MAIWDLQAPDDDLARAIEDQKASWRIDRIDVTSAADIDRGMAALVAQWGRVDVLVNNAGIIRDVQLIRWKDGTLTGAMTDADFGAVLDVNLWGVFRCTRAAVPHMIRQGAASCSWRPRSWRPTGTSDRPTTSPAKQQWSAWYTWARELGRHGIRVNAVAPGVIRTRMSASIPPAILETMTARTPLGRLGDPADIAEAYVWLASDRARFVHGTVLAVDGGLVIGT